MPEDLKFLQGDVYRAYAFVGDAAGLVFLGGIVWAIVRRYIQRPYRIRIKSKPEHVVILGTFFAIGVSGFLAEMFRIAVAGSARATSSGASSATRCRSSSTAGRCPTCRTGTSRCGSPTSSSFIVFLAHPADHDAAPHVHVAAEHVPEGQGPAEGCDAADAEPHRDRARELRRVGRRGLHLEAAARPRRLHDVRPLHQRLPGPRHRQVARPARDRPQGRRGDGRHRQPGRQPAARHRRRDHGHRQLAVRADHRRGALGLHDAARRATRSARSTSRSPTRSSTCGATCR